MRKVLLLLLATLGAIGLAAPQPSNAVPRASTLFFGVNVPSLDSDLPGVKAQTDKTPRIVNVWVKADSPTFSLAMLQRIDRLGAIPMISLEPWSWKDASWYEGKSMPNYTLRRIIDGSLDANYKRFATYVAQFKKPVVVRFAHEQNGWWYPWSEHENGNKPGEYIQAWRHVHDVWATAGATSARWVWSPGCVTGSPKETPLEKLYPGDSYVNYLGLTGYSRGASATATFDPSYKRLVALSKKKIIITEVGADGANKATWIKTFFPYIYWHPQIAGFVWFQTTPASGANGDYRYNSSPAALQAFRNGVATLPLSAYPFTL